MPYEMILSSFRPFPVRRYFLLAVPQLVGNGHLNPVRIQRRPQIDQIEPAKTITGSDPSGFRHRPKSMGRK
jgi:hypothetical protein